MSTGRGGGAVEIPASTKKVVQNLKEVVGNSDEEIYAMLKECNMDPNETVQRLLNQDPFHEVKRKRDKKKESGPIKETADMRGRPGSGGNYGRGGGRGGPGRGNSLPRHGSHEYSAGRGRPFGRENGIHPSSRGSSAIPNSSSPSYGQPKPAPPAATSVPAPVASQPATPQPQAPSSTAGSSPGLPNGSSGYVRPAPAPQGAWASGHTTMADILKARAAPVFQAPPSSPAIPPVQPAVSPSYSVAALAAPSSESSEFYSSTTDPVLHPSHDSRALGAQGAIKRDVGTVGNQRPIGDRPISTSSVEISLVSALPSQQSSPSQTSTIPPAVDPSLETELEVLAVGPSSPPASAELLDNQELSVDQAAVSMEAGTPTGSQSHQPEGRTVLGGSQFNGRPMYASQQQPVGTQKAASGAGLEWKPKASVQSSAVAAEGPAQSMSAADTNRMAQTLQSLNIHDDEPVIIPSHLRVPEADRTHLSFGSFGADFRTSFDTNFVLEEVENNPVTHVEIIPAEEPPVEQPAPSSVEAPVELAQSYGHQQVPTPVDNMSTSIEAPSVVHSAPVAPPLEQQLPKPDPVVQQSPHYPFLGVSNYPGFGLMPQIPGGQYAYEQAESQPQDISRIPSLMPYSDPTTSYYTSALRPGADGDSRYPPYATSNTSSKYNGNMGLMTGPTLPSSQEGGNQMLASSGPTVAPTTQPGTNVQTAQAIPQQALPMHYSSQPPPLGQFANFFPYQYMPPNYPYLQPTYHHNFNPSNSAYAQPPTGSSYSHTGASSYPTGGATAVKYPLPQYKPGTAAGNAPHSAAGIGYGGYTTAPSGYATNPVVTAGNTAGYEDVNTSHYKDNTLYIPNQQGEGSTVWIQTPLPRDMGPSGGMQTNSYYNLAGQGQHSGYAHSQQPTHSHAHPGAAYANLYHPSQSGPAPSHQMLQQPQGMGGGGAGNAQAGAYQQQPQRTQQTWNPNY